LHIFTRIALLVLSLSPVMHLAAAQQTATGAQNAAELIAQEKLRSAVEEAFAIYTQPADSGAVMVDNLVNAALQLLEIGPEATPYIINELEQAIPNTYYLCAYALALMNTPEAETALRRAIEQCEREKGNYPVFRKAWAAVALAMMGKADALDLLNSGQHKAGVVPIHARWSALETAALHTYPDSIPKLLSMLERYADDPETRDQRDMVIRALRHLADPAAIAALKEVMEEPNPTTRSEAARALGAIDRPEAKTATLAALEDDDGLVRRAAAWSLLQSGTAVDLELILARLEVEEDTPARSSLYELAARTGGADCVGTLMEHWGRQEGSDRASLMTALGIAGSEQALPTIREGLFDRDGRVTLFAAKALGAIRSERSIGLLIEGLGSRNPLVVQESARMLRQLRATRAAPMIMERLFKVELVGTLRDASYRDRAKLLSEALVDFRYHEALDSLRSARDAQTGALVIGMLDGVIARLEAIRTNKRKAKRWIAAMSSDNELIRRLAYEMLGEIGGAPAARAMSNAFGRVDPGEGLAILQAMGGMEELEALELVERVLLAPEFDPVGRAALREMAAWGARRIGGDRMFEALKNSAARRRGRDVHVLIYLAVLGRERALPIFDEYRISRMRYVSWMSGKELEKLNWIRRHLSQGGSLSEVDVSPEEILFQ
jgi:HEAT repeat protein